MKKFGLIGSGISKSKSPALFGAAYGGKYQYDLLDGNDFNTLFQRFKKEYTAVNVTSPFKETAVNAADEAQEAALLCGAANMLLKLPNGRIIADNADFEGVTLSIMSAYAVAGVDVDDEDEFTEILADKTALVVGCGGAGRAAAAAAVTLGYGQTILMNRTRAKAEDVKKHLQTFYEDLSEDELTVAELSEFKNLFAKADLVIYTLPVALEEDMADIAVNNDRIVLEANYTTPWLEQWKDKFNYISGLNWLYNQATVAFEGFTEEAPDEEAMKQAL